MTILPRSSVTSNLCSRFDVNDDRKVILDHPSQEEIIIDEILSLPMDSLLTVPRVPDRLLSPLVTRHRQPGLNIVNIPGSVEEEGSQHQPKIQASTPFVTSFTR